MSLTLLVKSRKWRLRYTLSRGQMVAALAVTLGLTFIAGRAVDDADQHLSRVTYTQTGLEKQQQAVTQLKQETEQRLNGMLLKLGEMQSQLHRLNALGEKLVAQADISADEFNFSQLPAAGGPNTELPAMPQLDRSQDVLKQMDAMLHRLNNKQRQLETLETVLLKEQVDAQMHLAGRPIASGWLSSYYGVRKDPFTGMPAMHKGLDFAGEEGIDVVATGAGVVTWAGERYGYGNLVEIEHGNGLVTRYGHNKSIEVDVGDVVTQGDTIAEMGNTGRSTGAHVHYEVLENGRSIDPLPFVYRESQVQ